MKTMTWMVLATVALSAGCAAQTGGEEGDASEELGTTAEALSVSSIRIDLDWHGGTGGTNQRRVSCGAGDVVVGAYGSHGSYINEVGFFCARLRTDGTLGPKYTTGTVGTRGPTSFRVECAAGHLATGLIGNSATFVDGIGVHCSNPKDRVYQSGDDAGGWGGYFFYDGCGSNYGLTSLTVRYGNWVDAVRPTCSYLNP